MRRILFASLATLLAGACSKDSVSFIPASPLTAAEVEQARQAFRNSPENSDLDVNEVVEANGSMFTYRVEDIQKALNGIASDDNLISICSSNVIDGAARIVLLAPEQADSVLVKSASCTPVQGGLSCGSVAEATMGYYKLPDTYFALQDGVTSAEARALMAQFEAGGITNLPEALQDYDLDNVMAISKSAEIYTLSLGDRYCNSCNAKVSVVMSPGSQLTVVGEPVMNCL